MRRRSPEGEPELEIFEHTFGSARVRETLGGRGKKPYTRNVEKLEVILSTGESYDLIANELPDDVTVGMDISGDPPYSDLWSSHDGLESSILYPEKWEHSIVRQKDGELEISEKGAERFTTPGDIWGFLHEVAHVQHRRRRPKDTKGRHLKYLRNGSQLSSDSDKRQFHELIFQPEIDAWVDGYRRERQLRRQGVVLEPDIVSVSQRVNIAMEHLATYAFDLFREGRPKRIGGGTAESERIFLERWKKMLDGEGRELFRTIASSLRDAQ